MSTTQHSRADNDYSAGQERAASAFADLAPMDEQNTKLLENVHPAGWANPAPATMYNLVVIGAGTAGLVTAAGAAGLGAKVALIERHLLGGDCLNVGCIPSKSLISSSRALADTGGAARYGILNSSAATADFPAIMERVRAIRAAISAHDSVQRFAGLGVDVFLGEGRFTGHDTIAVGNTTLRFKKAAITTGGRAIVPEIEGGAQADFLTNATIFNLTGRPERLAVIGGGPIGCEMAQAFARLGTRVTLFHRSAHLLNREDADAAAIIHEQFMRDGIQLVLGCAPYRVESGDHGKTIYYRCGASDSSVTVDHILASAGRAPNVEHLNLAAAGVACDRPDGIIVNDRLRTSNPRIYAAGDVCMGWKFTHAADAAARIVIQNALFFGRKKLSALTMPWCTYTDPEVAHVGMYAREADEKGIPYDTFSKPFSEIDRAVTDGRELGFVKVHVLKGTDRILGATIVAQHAGDMISELTLAMVGGIGLGQLSGVIHPYPTRAEAIRHIADAYNRTRLTPTVKKLLTGWMALTR